MMANPLARLVAEVQGATGPVRRTELAERLGVEPSALDGMLQTLERKQLVVTPAASTGGVVCSSGCGATCTGPTSCPFVASLPEPIVLRSPSRR